MTHTRTSATAFLLAMMLLTGGIIACAPPTPAAAPQQPSVHTPAAPLSQRPAPTSIQTPLPVSTPHASPSASPASPTPEAPVIQTPQPSTQASIRVVAHWKDGSGRRFGDVWGEGDFAYIGHAYDGGGVQIVDLSNPASPVHAGTWRAASGDSRSQDVKVQQGIGYFGAEGGTGVHVVDLRDPYRPHTLSVIDASMGGVDRFHNLFVAGPHLYIADNRTPQILVFDVADPTQPVKVQTIEVPDVPKLHDVTVANHRLYSAGGMYTHVFDISDLANPTLISAIETGENTHSNWPTPTGEYLAVANEVPGGTVTLWDIRKPHEPAKMATLDPNALGFGNVAAHNPVIMDNTLYVSWLTAGLQIFDISNPNTPRHLGGFNTTQGGHKQPLGGGNWGVYPFGGHQRVLASDENTGLWILDASSLVSLRSE